MKHMRSNIPLHVLDLQDDLIQPFQLESSQLRGRAVKLGPVLDEILGPHAYPETVAHMVAETITLALLLASMLKYEGIFTLQAKGDGPIGMLVADVTSNGDVRGCATYDPERLAHADEQIAALHTVETSQNHLAQYLGKGYIAFTVDQGAHTERYQGIVELKGSSLVDCVQHYFSQSEQIGTGIQMAAGIRDGKWRAGGLMLQHMPEDRANPEAILGDVNEDDWRRAMILMGSCRDDEFLAADLTCNELLFRLFNEEGVRIYAPIVVTKDCRCEIGKIEALLAGMPDDDIDYMIKDGKIEVRCEFCSRTFEFEERALRAKIASLRKKETVI